MYENIKKSIYKIVTADGTGTGFKLEGYDFVITNYHVVKGNKKVTVENNKEDKFIAKVVLVSPEADIAFLVCKDLKRDGFIKISDKITPKTTDKIFIYGFPFGMPITTTEGIISSANQPMDDRYYIQTDAAVNPGNSGGAMVDMDGFLVAITTAKFTDADNVGFGIKHTDLLSELNSFKYDDELFRLKCDSCDNYIEKESEFCQNCGSEIDVGAFEDFKLSLTAEFVESALSSLTKEPLLYRAGKNYWQFHQGSNLVRIFVVKENSEEYLIATSPMNELAKENLEKLFLYVVSTDVSPYMLGITDNKIYLSYRIHVNDMQSKDKDAIKENLANFPLKAVEFSSFFKEKYGCTLSFESKI